MHIEAGDVIPVDGVLVDGYDITCDESTATGEGDAIKKISADLALSRTEPGAKFDNKFDPFILSGSKVLSGVGKYVVTAIGVNSYHGRTLICTHPTRFNISAARRARGYASSTEAHPRHKHDCQSRRDNCRRVVCCALYQVLGGIARK